MIVKIKRIHPNAVIPTYAKPGDAALDLTCVDYRWDMEGKYYEYRTGLKFEVPEGYVGLLFPRSSLSNKDLLLTNHVGVLDSGYRGEVTFRYKALKTPHLIYRTGERVGQIIIIPYPTITFIDSEQLSESERGVSGYGSSGK